MNRLKWSVMGLGLAAAVAISFSMQQGGTSGFAFGQTALEQDSPELARAHELSAAFRQVSQASLPAVVSIKTAGKVVRQRVTRGPSPFDDPLFRRFFDERNFPGLDSNGNGRQYEREYRTPGGMGSGFIFDSSGLIMTNAHVVADASEVTVRLADGREFTAQDIKVDRRSDVAVIRIAVDEQLPFLPLGNDDEVQIGDWVLAFGSPFGLHHSVTQGIISAKGRGLLGSEMPQEFLQTDAAINPGNSGGPLVNLRGEVIGVNTAISTRSGGYDGVSLAVPVNLARWVAEQLHENGAVRRGYIGITMQEVDADLAPQFNLRVPRGVAVTGVVKDSPADKAGFQEGDVILQVNGRSISNNRNMLAVVEQLAIGKTYTIRVLRNGDELDLKITVAERPADLMTLEENSTDDSSAETDDAAEFTQLGMDAQNLTPDLAEQLQMPSSGVVITSVKRGGPAAEAGLSPGMVITRAGNQTVKNTSDLMKTLENAEKDGRILLLVRISDGRSNVSRFVTVDLGDDS